jgi:hypothetical protein
MSFISDFKSSPFGLFGGTPQSSSNYTSTYAPPIAGTSTDPSLASLCGTKWNLADGRVVALVQTGASAIGPGLMVQAAATISTFVDLAVPSSSNTGVGSTSITVTLGGTPSGGVVANQFAGGYAIVTATSSTGYGQMLRIASHPAAAASGSLVLTLEDPLSVALTTGTSTVSLILPQYGSLNGIAGGSGVSDLGVIVTPATTLTGRVLGTTLYYLPASTATVPTYGFIVTNGAAAVLNQGGTTISLDIMCPSSSAGAVATYTVASGSRVGTSTVAGQNGKTELVTLQL